MSTLPLFNTPDRSMMLLQTLWKSSLDPVLKLPFINGTEHLNIQINVGVTNINHKLSRIQQGWFLTDINGAASIYRSQPFNSTVLTLTSNAQVTVNLWVF